MAPEHASAFEAVLTSVAADRLVVDAPAGAGTHTVVVSAVTAGTATATTDIVSTWISFQ